MNTIYTSYSIRHARGFMEVGIISQLFQHEITGGNTIEDAAGIFIKVLNNEATKAQKNVVIANSALAIQCISPFLSIFECIDQATESIESGKALQAFKTLLSIQ